MPQLVCAHCEQPFYSRNSTAIFCSRACHYASKRNRAERICGTCGSRFLAHPSDIAAGGARYCSRSCAMKSRAGQRLVAVTCGTCNTSFQMPLSRQRNGPPYFCCRGCLDTWRSTIRGVAHPLTQPRVESICECCGKVYKVKPYRTDTTRFCSSSCSGIWIHLHFPNGPTSIETAIAQLLRDNDISFLQEHHIGPYVCDFALPEYRVIVECDGTYWHQSIKTKAKDLTRDLWFAAHAWKVVRLPEEKIKADLPWCKKQILRAIR
jgi:very-short-patch-repair endonuclease